MAIKINWKNLQKRIINGKEVEKVMLNGVQIRPSATPSWWEFYYSDDSWQEFLSVTNSTWSIQFQDSWERFRFYYWVYIWNRTALDFNWYTMRTIDLDSFTYTSDTIDLNINSRVWYFWNNRILTSKWILDYSWNVIQEFSIAFNSITPWLPWTVWANDGFDIYKWTVSGDSIIFTYVGTSETDQYVGQMSYGRLWAYLFNGNDSVWDWKSSYVNPSTDSITTISTYSPGTTFGSRLRFAYSWQDGNMYRQTIRYYWWWAMEKVSNEHEWYVWWESLSDAWRAFWTRCCKFLWNIAVWGMNTNWGTWIWYWSNNYYIDSEWATVVQSNPLAYDSYIIWYDWFIDEKWYIYPRTDDGWNWVILKSDATFSNLNWKNPYLWR